jgi:urease accessory protein
MTGMKRILPRVVGLGAAAAVWAALALPAMAHEQEVIRYGSFLGGFTHPVLGPDHLLAMLSVGILSTQIGGRAILTVPATFVSVMAVGGMVGILWGGIPLEAIELGIGLSVLVLGAIIALGGRLPVLAAMAAVGFFGFMHGYAHGVETPSIAEPVLYSIGFLSGTATIHLAGVLIGEVAKQYRAGIPVLRGSGGVIAVMGAVFLFGVL